MSHYRITVAKRGTRGGPGHHQEWEKFFGDETASGLRFSLDVTPRENETLRRSRCERGHEYSTAVSACPKCALERAAERERRWSERVLDRVAKKAVAAS